MGAGDDTLDCCGWTGAASQYDSLFNKDIRQGRMPPGSPIVADKWFPAAHIDFYMTAGTKQQTIGLGDARTLGNYYWTNKFKRSLQKGDSAYYIIASNQFSFTSLII